MAAIITLSCIFSMPIGHLADKYGGRISTVVAVESLYLLANLQLALHPDTEDPSAFFYFPLVAQALHLVTTGAVLFLHHICGSKK